MKKHEIDVIFNKKTKVVENGIVMIDTDELNKEEIQTLVSLGYEVKLFNQVWIKKPYYRIEKIK